MKKEELKKIWDKEINAIIEEYKEELEESPEEEEYLNNIYGQFLAVQNLLNEIEWKIETREFINNSIPTKISVIDELSLIKEIAKRMNGGNFDKILKIANVRSCNGRNYNGEIYYNGERIKL
jgi:hypothetical protein